MSPTVHTCQGYYTRLSLFSDFSHKPFVTYSQSVLKEHRALLDAYIMVAEAFRFRDQQPMQEATIREVAAWLGRGNQYPTLRPK